jgi:hypothetical protein
MSVIPNAVGRLDDVVEAIRDGDRERAYDLLHCEFSRLVQKKIRHDKEGEKIRHAQDEVGEFMLAIRKYQDSWDVARKLCGWSGVEGFEGPVETLPVKPAIRVQDLYIGQRIGEWRITGFRLRSDNDGEIDLVQINGDESLTLPIPFVLSILRHGVEFRLPEGGRNEG